MSRSRFMIGFYILHNDSCWIVIGNSGELVDSYKVWSRKSFGYEHGVQPPTIWGVRNDSISWSGTHNLDWT